MGTQCHRDVNGSMVTQLISQGLPAWEHSSSTNNIAQQANIVDIESIRQEYERSWCGVRVHDAMVVV